MTNASLDKRLTESIEAIAKLTNEMMVSRENGNLTGDQKIEVRAIAENEVKPVKEEVDEMSKNFTAMQIDITDIKSSSKTMSKIITIEDLLKNTLIGNDIKIYWSIRNSSLYRTDISNLSKKVLKRDIYTSRFHKILDLRIEYGYGNIESFGLRFPSCKSDSG